MDENIYIETALGGYVKKDVLAKLGGYRSLIAEIDRMMISDAAINAKLLEIRHMPMRRARILFLPVSGFSVSHTDSLIAEYESEIARKVML